MCMSDLSWWISVKLLPHHNSKGTKFFQRKERNQRQLNDFIFQKIKIRWFHFLYHKVTKRGLLLTLKFYDIQKSALAGFRPNSKINGNFRKIENFDGHFINRQKWRLQPNFECVGVFLSRDIAIWNLEISYRGNYPSKWFFLKSFILIVKITQNHSSSAIFIENYRFILELLLKFDF